MKRVLLPIAWILCATTALAQGGAAPPTGAGSTARQQEIEAIRAELTSLSARLDALERSEGGAVPPAPANATSAAAPVIAVPAVGTAVPAPGASTAGAATAGNAATPAPAGGSTAAPAPVLTAADTPMLEFFRGTTLNFTFDGYYGYNYNEPIGQVNQLRAYTVTSNSFNINQADVILERLPTPESRFGGRLDLMFGQATETLQGSSANEERPQVWRNLYQAYGSYLAPVGKGLEVDFGKWASSLGVEGNYTKDQIAYSRGFLFDYLPFYHTGFRANYNVGSKLNVAYWLVNGAQQTEDLNGFKSQAFLFTLQPAKTLSWNVNYYFGEEGRAVEPTVGTTSPPYLPQPGLPVANVTPTPNGREHIFDTYAKWQATPRLLLEGEADFVLNRTYAEQQPGHVALGAFELQYALPHAWHLGGRMEYLDDRSGLFSGTSQALKEFTLVADHTFAPGFLARAEYRRDFSNQRFFLTDTPGALVEAQPTTTLGLVYWWGMKQGSW